MIESLMTGVRKSSTKTEQNVVTALMICAFAFIYAKSFYFFMMRIIYNKFKVFLKACRSLSTSFTCVVTANVYE